MMFSRSRDGRYDAQAERWRTAYLVFRCVLRPYRDLVLCSGPAVGTDDYKGPAPFIMIGGQDAARRPGMITLGFFLSVAFTPDGPNEWIWSLYKA